MGACVDGDKERAAQLVVEHDSVLTKDNDELQRQKDSLLISVRGLFGAMSTIDSAATMAGVKKEPNKGEPIKAYEEVMRARTVKALQRLKTVETRLNASVAKVQKISGENEQLKTELASFRDMAASLQTGGDSIGACRHAQTTARPSASSAGLAHEPHPSAQYLARLNGSRAPEDVRRRGNQRLSKQKGDCRGSRRNSVSVDSQSRSDAASD